MMFDEGTGPPIVVIPGVQGRWEWMRPALRALSAHGRVISYSLAAAKTFDDLIAQVDGVLDRCGAPVAAICGAGGGEHAGARVDAVAGAGAVPGQPVAVHAGVSRLVAGADVAGDRRG